MNTFNLTKEEIEKFVDEVFENITLNYKPLPPLNLCQHVTTPDSHLPIKELYYEDYYFCIKCGEPTEKFRK